MTTPHTSGIILFAHGSRDPNWRQPFESILNTLRENTSHATALAFLEMMQPSLPEAIETMINAGIDHIQVVPVFLAVGSHVRKDLPLLLEEARNKHPQLTIHATAAIGEQQQIQTAIAEFALSQLIS